MKGFLSSTVRIWYGDWDVVFEGYMLEVLFRWGIRNLLPTTPFMRSNHILNTLAQQVVTCTSINV